MAVPEDPSAVLEQWINDTSNLAPELNHLLEEIEAKDQVIKECRNVINRGDMALQKHVKSNGGNATNPKEEQTIKTVLANFDKAQAIQNEKSALAEKAHILLDRKIKLMDQQIKQLEIAGQIPPDPLGPSLLNDNSATRIPGLSAGPATPSHPINSSAAAGTAGPSTTIANSALARLVTNNPGVTVTGRGGSPVGTPTSATSQTRPARESSTDATKRRRLNIPAASSNLRQSSAGPGTPKAGTPQPAGRAGSVPRGATKTNTKNAVKHLAPPKGGQLNPAKQQRKKKAGVRKKGGVSDADDSAMSAAGDESGSERLSTLGDKGKDGTNDVEMGGVDDDDDDGADTSLYCTCRSVSYGNMVACDNDECPYEWFHWGCVGLTKEPAGQWHCEECSIKLGLRK